MLANLWDSVKETLWEWGRETPFLGTPIGRGVHNFAGKDQKVETLKFVILQFLVLNYMYILFEI